MSNESSDDRSETGGHERQPSSRQLPPALTQVRLVIGIASGGRRSVILSYMKRLPELVTVSIDGPDTLLAAVESNHPDAVLLLEDGEVTQFRAVMTDLRARWPAMNIVVATRDQGVYAPHASFERVSIVQLPLRLDEMRQSLLDSAARPVGSSRAEAAPQQATQPTLPRMEPSKRAAIATGFAAVTPPPPPPPPPPMAPSSAPAWTWPSAGADGFAPAPPDAPALLPPVAPLSPTRANPEPPRARRPASAPMSGEIRRSHRDPPPVGGRVLAVAGAKGGVGASTIAVHLAVVAARHHHQVCLVDLSLTGDVAMMLGLDGAHGIRDLAGLGEIRGHHLERALRRHGTGVQVLAAPAWAEQSFEINEIVAARVIAALRSRFGLVIVDIGCWAPSPSASVVGLADETLIVTTPDIPAIKGVQRLASTWARLGIANAGRATVVMNRVRRDQEVQPSFIRSSLRGVLSCANTVVPANFRALQPAVNRADPGLVGDRGLQRALSALATEVGLIQPPVTPRGRGRGQVQRRTPSRRDAGQAALEFVGVLPLVLLIGLFVWQTLLIGFTWELTGRAADRAGRRLEVADTDAGIHSAAIDPLPGGWRQPATVRVDRLSSTVTVVLRTPLIAPGLGLGTLPLSFTARQTVIHEEGLDLP